MLKIYVLRRWRQLWCLIFAFKKNYNKSCCIEFLKYFTITKPLFNTSVKMKHEHICQDPSKWHSVPSRSYSVIVDCMWKHVYSAARGYTLSSCVTGQLNISDVHHKPVYSLYLKQTHIHTLAHLSLCMADIEMPLWHSTVVQVESVRCKMVCALQPAVLYLM